MDLPRRSPPLLSLLLTLFATALGVASLLGHAFRWEVPGAGPLGVLRFAVDDATSGVFVLLAGLVGTSALLAGRREAYDPIRRVLTFAFLLGLVLVPMAGDVFGLLFAWELMSVAPGVLLVLDARPEARRAGVLYLAYAQLSSLAVLAGLLLWSGGRFGTLDSLVASAGPPHATLLILLGALVKAGVMPFHSWLPEAHPAAPSHVSALMSGVMVALPAYLVLRLVVPPGVPAALATIVLLLGAASAALAALHALHARDLKRVLALTTVAHMGVLFSLLGVALLLPRPTPGTLSATVASTAIAYAFAHGLSKGALFLVAGEIHHATGELALERLGGLWRTLGPVAALAGLAGLALAGLPPFAGFPAELSLFTSLFAAMAQLDALSGVVALAALFLIGVGAGAGLAAVAKVVLGAFHGPARTAGPAHALPRTALIAPALLLAASLVVGLAPGLLWAGLPTGAPDPWTLPMTNGSLAVAPMLAAGVAVLLLAAFAVRAAPRPRRVPPWATGGPPPTPRQTYTPQALVMPYRILFAELLRPRSDLRVQDAPVAPFAPSKGHYEDPSPQYIEPWVHQPLLRTLVPILERLRRLHRGPVQIYLIIALLALVFILFLLPVIR